MDPDPLHLVTPLNLNFIKNKSKLVKCHRGEAFIFNPLNDPAFFCGSDTSREFYAGPDGNIHWNCRRRAGRKVQRCRVNADFPIHGVMTIHRFLIRPEPAGKRIPYLHPSVCRSPVHNYSPPQSAHNDDGRQVGTTSNRQSRPVRQLWNSP